MYLSIITKKTCHEIEKQGGIYAMFWSEEKKAKNNKYVIYLAKQNEMHFFKFEKPKRN